MAKKGTKTRTVYREKKKKTGHRAGPGKIHLIPAVLETVGVLYPGLDSNEPNGGFLGIASSTNPTMQDKFGAFMGGLSGYTNMSNLVPAGALIVSGLVAKWVGKKVGLSNVGTKRVKIL